MIKTNLAGNIGRIGLAFTPGIQGFGIGERLLTIVQMAAAGIENAIEGECYEYQCSGCVKKGNEVPPPAQNGSCAQDNVESGDSNEEYDEDGYSINW